MQTLDGAIEARCSGGIGAGQMAMSGTIRQEMSDDRAYLVIATVYTFNQNGIAMRAPAQMTFALQKGDASWKISAWTYAAPSASPVKP